MNEVDDYNNIITYESLMKKKTRQKSEFVGKSVECSKKILAGKKGWNI